jgi:glycosyltransferase involved in cell wall biosynthesis
MNGVHYEPAGGATKTTHYCSRTFENAIWHSHAVFDALQKQTDIKPDLIVGHTGFGTTLFLRELHGCPIINYFEYFYRTTRSDMDFRTDFPAAPIDRLRARARNAAILLDLENCDAAVSPTAWQRDRFPSMFHSKINVIFDGIDTNLWRPMPKSPRRAGNITVPDDVKLVTYATRGMESMRGFDIFMKFAKVLYQRRPDVRFIVVGEDRVCYGGDQKHTGGKSFKEWVLRQDRYDLSKFAFIGTVPPESLAQLFSITDLHVYLTVPFVLSWSLMNALACGTTVMASNTAPVQEMITHGQNGLLVDFFDVEAMALQAEKVLSDPSQYATLGRAGTEFVKNRYSLETCLQQIVGLYERTARQSPLE